MQIFKRLSAWKDKVVGKGKGTSELPPFDKGKRLFLAWKEADPYFHQRFGFRSFNKPKGSPGHPCPVCKDKYTWFGKPCGPCRRDLNIWCPCPKPVSDYICPEYCIRCGLDIKELWDIEPELDAAAEDAVFEKYEKMSNYHLLRWKLKCKKEVPEFKDILADRIIAEDRHQVEYLLEEALARLGETTKLRETNPDVLKMNNWEIVNLGVIKFGWESRTSIYER